MAIDSNVRCILPGHFFPWDALIVRSEWGGWTWLQVLWLLPLGVNPIAVNKHIIII